MYALDPYILYTESSSSSPVYIPNFTLKRKIKKIYIFTREHFDLLIGTKRNDSKQNTYCQSWWDRLPHHQNGQPTRNQMRVSLLRRWQELAPCQASGRGHLHRQIPGTAELSSQGENHWGCQIHPMSGR